MNLRRWLQWKTAFVLFYGILGGFILFWNWDTFIYEDACNSFCDLPRLYASIAFSFAGFALLASLSIMMHPNDSSFPWSYLYWYLPFCTVSGLFIFDIFQIFERTNGYLFNFTAYPLAFFAGFLSEWIRPLLPDLLKRSIERLLLTER